MKIIYISITCVSFVIISKYIYNEYLKKKPKKKEIINFIDSEDDQSYYSYSESNDMYSVNNEYEYDSNHDSNHDSNYDSNYDGDYEGDY
jgi:hypothetical protein